MSIRFKHNYIALADILANGIAIMLILIVLSLSLKQQQQDNELEQISRVGSVMSRNIASSIIMNNLPSSGPARLHNYNHPRHKNAPLIQLHKDFLLIKDRGNPAKALNWKVTQKELLLKNNRFDKFLKSLNAQQKQRMRADVVSIKQFYLVMAIVKSHQLAVRHWHFDSKKTALTPENNDFLTNLNLKTKLIEAHSLNNDLFKPATKNPTEKSTLVQKLPNDVDFSALTPVQDPFKLYEKQLKLSYGKYNSGAIIEKKNADMLEKMTKLFAQNRGLMKYLNNDEFMKNLEISFTGKKETGKGKLNKKPLLNQKSKKSIQEQLIALLLNYLDKIQTQYDKHNFVDPNLKDFIKYKLPLNKYQKDIKNIYQSALKPIKTTEFIPTSVKIADFNAVKIRLNKNIENIEVISQNQLPWLDEHNRISFNIFAQPTINEAKIIKLKTNDIMLLPYHNRSNRMSKTTKWFIVAILNQKLNKIKVGFVYGKLKNKHLILTNSQNDLMLNNSSMVDYYASKKSYYELIQMAIAIFLALLILMVIFRKKRVL